MDILAHGLWTNVVYGQAPPRRHWWGVFFGVAPDLASFGVFFMQRLVTSGLPFGQPELITIPSYIYHLYNYTHSLVVFVLTALVVYLARGRRLPWVMGGWGLHIAIDIFTHGRDFFPTPFLWPLSHATVNSFSWADPWFMALNYGALAVVYVAWYWRTWAGRRPSRRPL